MPTQVIRRVRLAHCKRGRARCPRGRELNVDAICLLGLYQPGESRAQRRALGIEIDGELVWREYEIVRCFENEGQARTYAADHGIIDVVIDG